MRPVITFIRKGKGVSLLLGPNTVSLGSEVFLLLEPDTTNKRKGSVLAIVAGRQFSIMKRSVLAF